MLFESFVQAQSALLWSAFAIAVVLGAVANKTNFCTMGAVSDMVNMGDYGRFRAWLLAIAVAIVGMLVLEANGLANPGAAFPPYRGSQLIWAENLLGGILFGIGMTLASGCGNKTLVRIGGGNLKSVVVLLIIGVVAYYMTNPFPGSDKTLFSVLFYEWIRPLSISLSGSQDLGTLVSSAHAATMRWVIGSVLALGLLFVVFRSAEFRGNFDNILGGVVVGVTVLAAWYVSSSVGIDADGDVYTLGGYYQEWEMLADSVEGKPQQAAPLAPQSFTFINPMGQTFGYAKAGFEKTLMTFGIMSLLGVILGSLLWAAVSKGFRFEWFVNFKDFLNHAIGAVLMGLGGVLAMGCTIGQGVTGISTLALGSFVAFAGIVLGSAMTMKIQYYRMVYEEEATFTKALLSALVDFKLLPASMRKLEAV